MLSLISIQYSSVITISAVILAPLLGHIASKYLMAWQHTIFGIFFAQIVGQVTLVNLCIQMLSMFSSQLFCNHRLISTPCPPPPLMEQVHKAGQTLFVERTLYKKDFYY